MATLVTKSEAITFFSNLNDGVTTANLTTDIDDFILDQSWSQIEDRIGFTYNTGERTLYLNGTGEKWIFVPYVPINSLTSIIVKDSEETETTIDLSGSNRDVWYDKEAGRIEFVDQEDNRSLFMDQDDIYGYKFTYGLENVEVTGSFGPSAPGYVKYLQLLLILKALQFKRDKVYKVDFLMEKLGKYQYQYGVPSSQSEVNQYRGIDGYIEYLFSIIPNSADVQAI